MKLNKLVVAAAAAFGALGVQADITVGVTLSATGPAASLGIPEKNTIALLPSTMGGEKVNYIVLDDASDTTTAVKNVRKLISENKYYHFVAVPRYIFKYWVEPTRIIFLTEHLGLLARQSFQDERVQSQHPIRSP